MGIRKSLGQGAAILLARKLASSFAPGLDRIGSALIIEIDLYNRTRGGIESRMLWYEKESIDNKYGVSPRIFKSEKIPSVCIIEK